MAMRKILIALLLSILFCPLAKGQIRYKLTINADAFFDLRNDNIYHEHTSQAVCTTEGNIKFEVKWVSYNVTADSYWNIYMKNGGGRIFNKTNLGKIISVSYGSSVLFQYYGVEEDPYNGNNTSIGNNVWGYFSVRNESSSSSAKVTNGFNITFEIDDTPTSITLDESSENNTSIIESNLNNTVNVSLYRSLTADMWNAICLPFNLNSEQKESLFGNDYQLQSFSGIGNENGGAQLNFQAVAATADLVAGTPYIVYPTISRAADAAVSIDGVTITSTTPDIVTKNDNNGNAYTFQGIYVPTVLEKGNKSIIFIGANNKFYWPNSDNPMKAFRAYFTLPSSTSSTNVSLSTEEQGVSNGISLSEVSGLDIQGTSNGIYTIHGQLVGTSTDQQPKGIYIINGHKFIVK